MVSMYGTVGDERLAGAGGHGLAVDLVGDAVRGEPLAGLLQRRLLGLGVGDQALDVLRREAGEGVLVGVDHEQVLHGGLSGGQAAWHGRLGWTMR